MNVNLLNRIFLSILIDPVRPSHLFDDQHPTKKLTSIHVNERFKNFSFPSLFSRFSALSANFPLPSSSYAGHAAVNKKRILSHSVPNEI
jgi:hypothetical protein